MNHTINKRNRLLFVCAALFIFSACRRENSYTGTPKKYNLTLHFQAMVDSDTLAFGNTYQNHFGEPFTVTAFKYYITNIQLINTDSNKVTQVSTNYYLVDAADSTAATIQLETEPYPYNRIAFTLGVDSVRNVSGAQTGALDPAKGMFWTWNTGYIMAKLEGNSPLSTAPNNKIEYHIGGFKTGESVSRTISLLFPFGETLQLAPGKTSHLNITANVNAWFYNPHEIKFQNTPAVMTPGALAVAVSENYSKMFTVDSVINNN